MSNKGIHVFHRGAALLATFLLTALTICSPLLYTENVFAEEGSGKWGAAADEIDKYLDTGFEY